MYNRFSVGVQSTTRTGKLIQFVYYNKFRSQEFPVVAFFTQLADQARGARGLGAKDNHAARDALWQESGHAEFARRVLVDPVR